jgi:hypothetical protein
MTGNLFLPGVPVYGMTGDADAADLPSTACPIALLDQALFRDLG